jgi:hypothetical protein
MLSGQFPWRQKAAERRGHIADATIAIVFVAIDGGLAWSGTGTAAGSNSASVSPSILSVPATVEYFSGSGLKWECRTS